MVGYIQPAPDAVREDLTMKPTPMKPLLRDKHWDRLKGRLRDRLSDRL